jgi:hypothetical protein
MKLTELQDMWTEDSRINEDNLGSESIRTPVLHSKYLTILSNTRLSLRKAESDYWNMRRKKYKYYRGEMSREELQQEGWEQWQGNKPLKNEMEEFLQVDEELLRLQDKSEYFKTVLYFLEQVIRSIGSRGWDIKNSIEWSKFTNGLM